MNKYEYLGIFLTKQEIANMQLEHIHVPDYGVHQILKTVNLTAESQQEVIDTLVDRTPHWMKLSDEERTNKMKIVLAQETVVEYLRLNEMVRQEADMLEVGIDEEGTIVVSVYYIEKNEEVDNALKKPSQEEIARLEREVNILDGRMDLVEEAKKRLEKKQGKVIPLNRAARRKATRVK